MKLVIAFAILTVAVSAVPPARREPLKVVEKEKPFVVREYFDDNKGNGAYNYAYELSNGEIKQEQAELKNGFLIIRGSYSQIDPVTGEQQITHYVADKNGYRPVGPHLPKSPKK